ncbi:tetratricopeptide repeat protein [Limnospira sp. PMC 1042.18]|uniref:tetratricopeptide repeat protein n=1 Tax=Limnospira sp. PMC 1042.18 TaxID=2981018 RepID=UPI0028ED7784|nr:tetratricopeptide repeat protein [Limnospira sp. PMC 1042.18]
MSYFSQGNKLLRSGKLEEAVNAFQKAIAHDPSFHWYHYKLGQAFKELGRLEEAKAAFQKAFELKPDLSFGGLNVGNLLPKTSATQEYPEDKHRQGWSQELNNSLVDNKYYQELFARGYIISNRRITRVPVHWKQSLFCDIYLAYDPRLNCHLARRADVAVMCLGLICDVRFPKQTTDECVSFLAESLAESTSIFYDRLSYGCGRFVIAAYQPEVGLFILTDATGMKSAFYYNQEAKIVGSHAQLVAENAQNAERRTPITFKFGYPGIQTPFHNIFLLTPNTQLNFDNFVIRRFFPVSPLVSLSLEQAVEMVTQYLKGAMQHFATFYQNLISLTAGLDSRVTLALNKSHSNVRYFTYYRRDSVDTDKYDKIVAEKLANKFGLSHEIFDLSQYSKAEQEFLSILKKNTYYSHIRSLAFVYYEKFSQSENLIHVRSNISETGREFYKNKKLPILSAKDLADLYLTSISNPLPEYIAEVIRKFEEFDRITKITQCQSLIDIKSLFYGEFRMAAWHSQVVIESDPAFDTVSIYNCIKTLEIMLSITREEREKSLILKKIIENEWPELTQFKINGKDFWS